MSNPEAVTRVVAFFEHIAPTDVARIGEIYAADAGNNPLPCTHFEMLPWMEKNN